MNLLLTTIYGTLIAAVIIRTFYADTMLRAVAFVMGVDWAASNLAWWFAPFDHRPIFVLTDIGLATAALLAWMTYRSPWMAVLSALYSISGAIGLLAYGPGSKYSFDLALNAAFLARLAVVWIASDEPRKAQEPSRPMNRRPRLP